MNRDGSEEIYYIYAKENCPWCTKAEELLKAHKVNYTKKMLGVDYDREYLFLRCQETVGAKMPLTVPRIWFGIDIYIGGYDDLVEWFSTA